MTSKTIKLPIAVIYILYKLQQLNYEAAIVGGAVRDLLMSNRSHVDFDFATNAKPEEIQAVFPNSFYENEFGTVAVTPQHLWEVLRTDFPAISQTHFVEPPAELSTRIIDLHQASKIHISLRNSGDNASQHHFNETVVKPFEITTYRSKELYENGYRRPSSFSWGESLEEDLARRDFTINALAIKIDQNDLKNVLSQTNTDKDVPLNQDKYELIDLYQGIQDLNNFVIRTVGDSAQRFDEDALRMLRAIRFSVQLNMQIDSATYQAILDKNKLIKEISWERIRDEFKKILSSPYPAEGIELLDEVGLLSHILPELLEAKGVEQGGHHTTDVWTHSLDALRECPSADPVVRLATLLHDIGKPRTYAEKNGSITFYNHEVVGSRMAKDIAYRLRLSSHEIERIFILVRYHMFHYQPDQTDSAIRRFMRKVGLEYIDDILALREADRLGSGARKTSWRLEEMKQRMIDQLHQPMDVGDLAINGHDLMTELGLKPGPILGLILGSLLETVLDNPERNTKPSLLKEARKLAEQLESER